MSDEDGQHQRRWAGSSGGPTTINDVARLAGLSPSTASRALSGYGYASDEAVRRVRSAAAELGYVPNAIARSLKSRSTRVIGMVVDDLAQSFFAEVAAGIEAVLRAEGYRLFLASSDGQVAGEAEAFDRFASMRVEGIIVAPATSESPAIVRAAARRGIPVVEFDRRAAAGICDGVLLENERGGYEAASHLLTLGHTRIAIICGPFTSGDGRLAGYQSALAEAGLPFEETLVARTGFHPANPEGAVSEVLDHNPEATAIIAGNNILAGGALTVVRRRGWRIPEDFSIVAFDDDPWMSFVEPALTTIRQPARAIGRETARLLLDRIEGSLTGPPVTRYLSPSLMIRQSTRARAPFLQGARSDIDRWRVESESKS